MTLIEKCELAISKGIRYDSETGNAIGVKGGVIKKKSHGYVIITLTFSGKDYYLSVHQFAWYVVYNCTVDLIDHIDGDKSNNRIKNLRSSNQQKNQWNQINAKGYYWNKKDRKFHARIKLNNKDIYLGSFDLAEDARKAYLEGKNKYHIII